MLSVKSCRDRSGGGRQADVGMVEGVGAKKWASEVYRQINC